MVASPSVAVAHFVPEQDCEHRAFGWEDYLAAGRPEERTGRGRFPPGSTEQAATGDSHRGGGNADDFDVGVEVVVTGRGQTYSRDCVRFGRRGFSPLDSGYGVRSFRRSDGGHECKS